MKRIERTENQRPARKLRGLGLIGSTGAEGKPRMRLDGFRVLQGIVPPRRADEGKKSDRTRSWTSQPQFWPSIRNG